MADHPGKGTGNGSTMPVATRLRRSLGRVIRFGLIRIVLAFLGIVGVANAVRLGFMALGEGLGLNPLSQTLLYTILLVPAVHLTYVGFVRYVERRRAEELSGKGALAEVGKGVVIGAALLSATVGVIAVAGRYQVIAVNPWSTLLIPLAMSLAAAYMEELLFRGVLFRIAEERLGTWLALLVSSGFFGLVHLGNPNATLLGALAICLEAGALLGAAYVLTRRLWLAIGVHLAWNFTQGGIFGVNVSGVAVDGLLESRLSGPTVLSGGALGVEASIVAVVLCLGVGVAFLVRAHRKGHFIAPFWRR